MPFNHFPPSLKSCGLDQSCYRYASSPTECIPETCDYMVIAKLESNDIHFTIGGRLKQTNGYIGIGFTADKHTLRKMDVCACVKSGSVIDPAHYHVKDLSQTPVKRNEILIDEEVDMDGQTMWCHFRRPLQVPGEGTTDLTDPLYQVFLWGSLDRNGIPVLPPHEQIVHLSEPWLPNETVNLYHVVGRSPALQSHLFLALCSLLIILLAS